MHWYPDMEWGSWAVMMVGMVLFWGLLLAVVVVLVRTPSQRPSGQDRPEPGRLLDERFARGEIDEAEYLARRRALELGTGHPHQSRTSTDR